MTIPTPNKKIKPWIYDVLLKIIKDDYSKNCKSIPWSGMHNSTVDKIIKIFKEIA